eukprot:2252684-Amphidinium_carterae.1
MKLWRLPMLLQRPLLEKEQPGLSWNRCTRSCRAHRMKLWRPPKPLRQRLQESWQQGLNLTRKRVL